jgi:starch-binding outer membrane protein, SusD/RagB family
MHRHIKTAGVVLGLAAMAGCDSFLTGPGLTQDPNFPTEVTAEQLLVATQARLFLQQQGQTARTAAIWTQQLAGVNNQQRDYGSRYDYARNELDTNQAFNGIYQAGGLIDLRRLQALAAAEGNTRVQAIAMIMEGFSMGTYASLWGDLPYREAINPDIPAPAIDPQEQIYADVQALLSEAITLLGSAPSTPLAQDLVYGGNAARWIAAAHTLKARFFLHVAPRAGQTAYQNALTHANQGINEAPATAAAAMHGQGPGDFRALHGTTLNTDANIWANFLTERADIAASKRMVDILKQRNDPRLAEYHTSVAGGDFRGSNQFGTGGDPQPWSLLNPAFRRALDFRQPFITWAETQLIKAEANFRLGNQDAARGNLNTVRQAVGLQAVPAALTGDRLFEEIMVEKWIVQFQNVDVFSDWRRSCFPRLIPGGPSTASPPVPADRVPGRYVYGSTERQQNPNFRELTPAQQPADNWNFRQQGACPVGNTGGETYPVP